MRGGLKLGIATGVLTATVALAVGPALGGQAKTELASRNASGEPGDDESQTASISRSGRFVVFASRTDNLPGGKGVNARTYVRDRKMGKTRLISKTSDGDPVDAFGSTLGGAISASGRYVVFSTNSSLLPGDHTGGQSNVYIRDRERGKTRLVSKTSAGDPATGGDSGFPTISASGRVVGFQSEATNLPGDHTYTNIYVPEDRADDAREQDLRW